MKNPLYYIRGSKSRRSPYKAGAGVAGSADGVLTNRLLVKVGGRIPPLKNCGGGRGNKTGPLPAPPSTAEDPNGRRTAGKPPIEPTLPRAGGNGAMPPAARFCMGGKKTGPDALKGSLAPSPLDKLARRGGRAL